MEIFNEKDCSPLFRKLVKGIPTKVCFDLVATSLRLLYPFQWLSIELRVIRKFIRDLTKLA